MSDTVSVRPLGSARCLGCGEEVVPDTATYSLANIALGEAGWRTIRFEKGYGLACPGCLGKAVGAPPPEGR